MRRVKPPWTRLERGTTRDTVKLLDSSRVLETGWFRNLVLFKKTRRIQDQKVCNIKDQKSGPVQENQEETGPKSNDKMVLEPVQETTRIQDQKVMIEWIRNLVRKEMKQDQTVIKDSSGTCQRKPGGNRTKR